MYRKSKLNDHLTSSATDKNPKFNELIEKTRFQNINSDNEALKGTENPISRTEKRNYQDILEIAVNDFIEDSKHDSAIQSQTELKTYFSNHQGTSIEIVNPNKSLYNVQQAYEKVSSETDFDLTEFPLAYTQNSVKRLLKQASFDKETLSNSLVSAGCNCSFFENCSKCDSLKFQMAPIKTISKFDFQEKKKIKETTHGSNNNIMNKNSLRKSKADLNLKSTQLQQNSSLKRYFTVTKAPNTSLNTAANIKKIKNNSNILKPHRNDDHFLKNNTETFLTEDKDYSFFHERDKLIYQPTPLKNNAHSIKRSTETSLHSETITESQCSDDFVFPLYSSRENNLTNSTPKIVSSHYNETISSQLQLSTIPFAEKSYIFQKGLKKITENEYLIYNPLYDNIPQNTNRKFILDKIEKLFSIILSNFVKKESGPSFKIRSFKWSNCKFIDDRLQLNKREDSRYVIVRYQSLTSQVKFNIIVYILGKCYSLVQTNSFCTKREIYYQIVNYVDCQERINDAINSVSCLLDVPPWELGVLASSKGLVYGNLEITLASGDTITFSNKGGTLIPQNPTEISSVKTNASFILVIEKDSIYQKLLDENSLNKLSSSFILITGKGYADTNTRLFLKILWMKSFKPAFILTDADPHGIDIMLTYRFGSLNSSHLSNYLALPNLRWLGILPSEIISFNIKGQPLSARDKNKIKSLLDRPYFQGGANSQIKREIEKLQEKKVKAEIEGIMKTDNFLSDVYLPNKFFTQNFI